METILLSNGTLIENAHCLPSDERLYVYIQGMDIRTGFELFIEPENTRTIVSNRFGVDHVYEGYTDMYAISMENNQCNVVLKKGAAANA